MSPKFEEFYKELWEWIQAGTPSHPIFTKDCGICQNAINWSIPRGYTQPFLIALHDSFVKKGLDSVLPFNDIITFYYDEKRDDRIWQNPKRLAWVRENAK